ncbi:DUF3885 domain-containing protein [Ferdinandcohnia quinoae]|uniref:DUF3885 domain-containing protein n=1 Tax=Fredinandcohnia quinoae TaxID=2918902 RepID=A0AAW5DXQ4_9BACI|nr:DUF3885 domain-containing protein [Fredinandcohnia sp. SECRCQ15]MCH1624853.1 DUF3885 domain-containing protein [Fredinandcohnia sp. SECRCQ15]
MKIIDYLKEKFPSLELVPSIYYQWDIGIHFSLGGDIYQFKENDELNLERFQLVYTQASTIFDELFDQDDDLFLVANMYKHKTNEKCIRKLKVYHPFIKCKSNLNRIQVKTYPYPFEGDGAVEYEMQQFSLLCKPGDLRVNKLLKAACNEDFPLKPRFGGYSISYPDVFFVNITKDIIFFVYDDRGCEVIALDAEQIHPLYENHRDWVEEGDKKPI